MKIVEKYANYADSDGIISLYDKFEKSLENNRTLAAKECGLTKASVYGWESRKEDLKHSTKVKILETLIEKLPLETFHYLTDKLYSASSETLLAYLSTLYEQSFDTKNENEFLKTVNIFEKMVEEYGGLIYKNRDLEVNKLFLKMNYFAKSKNYQWTPHQTILLEYESVRLLIPRIVASWFYSSLPQTPEELAKRTMLPIDIVRETYDEFKKQFSLFPKPQEEDIARVYVGVDTTGTKKPQPLEYLKSTTAG